jgi:hypothetical protein
MPEPAIKRHKPKKKAAKQAAANEEIRGARIEVLTCDPRRKVVIMPGCHIDSMRRDENAYFFQAGDELIGMIVEGGTVEYQPADHTYVVRLADGHHTTGPSSSSADSPS